MRRKEYQTDLCVIGGGLAGLCASIAAARHGTKVILIQDRPVLGGNASSEIRMWICGAQRRDLPDVREGGIVEELSLQNYFENPQLSFPVWDGVLYQKAIAEKNLTLLLNTSCFECKMDGDRIESVTGWQSNAETYHTVRAAYFADCSGDSILAPLTGAKYRYGREAKAEFDESIPPDEADRKTMGMSCLFQIREYDHPIPFTPPASAYRFLTDDDLPYKSHKLSTNFWWIELGGEWDCIHDTDRCREELLRICYGVWDHMKNHGDHGVENWAIDWIGFLPGKRESRRYVGKVTVTQNDVEEGGHFPDVVAYAGWTMDDHFPQGFAYKDGYPTIFHPAPSPWGLPLRCMISENISNLLFAGRNISVTHAALSSTRVMGTCAILGQALGTAVSIAVRNNCSVSEVPIEELQQTLMTDDCMLPGVRREIPTLSKEGYITHEILRNGVERGEENLWIGSPGDAIGYEFETPTFVSSLRAVFDSNFNRIVKNMPCSYPLHQEGFEVPKTLIRDFDIILTDATGAEKRIPVRDSHVRLFTMPINAELKSVHLKPLSTWGEDTFRIFSLEVQ